MSKNSGIIKEIKEYTGTEYDINGEEYVMIFNHEWNEIISIILDQAIIMVEDEMYEDNPSYDSLQRKLIDLRGNDEQ